MYSNDIIKQIKRILSKFLWWQPVTILLLMFVIGLSSFAAPGSYKNLYSSSSSNKPEQLSNTYVLGQEDFTKEAKSAQTDVLFSDDSLDQDVVEKYTSDTDVQQENENSENRQETQDMPASEETSAEAQSTSTQAQETGLSSDAQAGQESAVSVKEDGNYISKEEVALYIHTYNKLPNNYITKKLAEQEGWRADGGNLDSALPGMCIGGGSFGNYEGKLPQANNRKYFECDIDYDGGIRNSKRLVYSNDGLIFYTEDGYNTFEQLY